MRADGPLTLVAPTTSFPELVRRDPAEPADEDLLAELYPNGQRGYARVYPSDDYMYAAGAMLAHRLGDGRVFFLADRHTAEGPGWLYFRRAARRIGLQIAGRARWHERRRSYREIAERVRASGARAVYIDAYVAANTGQMLRDLRAILAPDVQIIGNPGFLPVGQLFENTGPAARGALITSPGPTTDKLGDRGQSFVHAFGATQPGGRVSMYAVYAAAATEVLLDAIARSDGTRASVTRALSETRLPDSALGPLQLDRNGEPTHPPDHGRPRRARRQPHGGRFRSRRVNLRRGHQAGRAAGRSTAVAIDRARCPPSITRIAHRAALAALSGLANINRTATAVRSVTRRCRFEAKGVARQSVRHAGVPVPGCVLMRAAGASWLPSTGAAREGAGPLTGAVVVSHRRAAGAAVCVGWPSAGTPRARRSGLSGPG